MESTLRRLRIALRDTTDLGLVAGSPRPALRAALAIACLCSGTALAQDQGAGGVITGASKDASQPSTDAVAPPITFDAPEVVDGTLPTLASNWGGQVAFAGDDILVTGAERVLQSGIDGQLMTVLRGSKGWNPLLEYAALRGIRPGSAIMQHVDAEGEWFVSNVERPDQTGEVQLLRRSASSPAGWEFFARMGSPPDRADPLFGSALDLRGGTLVVGTTDSAIRSRSRRLVPSPRVHIFSVKDGTWGGDGFLEPPAGAEGSIWFGVAVAAAGDRVFVANPQAFTPIPKQPLDLGSQPPAVYVYHRGGDPAHPSTWALEATITQPLGMADNAFGINIAADGTVLVVRSVSLQAGEVNAQRIGEPSMLVYRRKDAAEGVRWEYDGALRIGPSATSGLGIGLAMDIDDGLIALGDTTCDNGTGTPGAVHIFGREDAGWREQYRLLQSVPCAPSRFGAAVAIQDRTVAVGRVRSEREQIEPGGVYIYRLP